MNENNNNDIVKLKFIYEEINESTKTQQGAIDMLNNKFNWIIASNIGVMALVFSKRELNNEFLNFSFFALLVSLAFSVISLWVRKYKRGPLLSELIGAEKYPEDKLLREVNKKMVEAININQKSIDELGTFLKIAIIFLVSSVVLLFLSILIK